MAKVLLFKELAPPELQLCGTIFHALALVGDLSNRHNHCHVDKHDLCSVIIMLGKGVTGGRTLYYDENGQLVHHVPFKHGRFQAGPFDQVRHAGGSWSGPRGILSFYVNRAMYEHFLKHDNNLLLKKKRLVGFDG